MPYVDESLKLFESKFNCMIIGISISEEKYFRLRPVCGYKYYYSGTTTHYDTSWQTHKNFNKLFKF